MAIKRKEPTDNTDQKWIPDSFEYSNVKDVLDTTYKLELDKKNGFEDYNTGNLNGQDNWSGSTDFKVQTTTKYSGSRAVSCNVNDDVSITTTFSDVTSGVISCYMRVGSNQTNDYSVFQIREGTTIVAFIDFADANLRYGTGSTPISQFNYNINQWYYLQIEIDPTNNKVRFKVDDGTWSSWSNAWNNVTFSKIDAIFLRQRSFHNTFWDDIELPIYYYPGYRVSEPLSLDSIKKVKNSNIKWTSTEPTGTDIKIYTAISDSNTIEPSEIDYSEATNDASIPSISADQDLTGKYLWVRQELSTEDADATPRLSTLEVLIETAKKSSFFQLF